GNPVPVPTVETGASRRGFLLRLIAAAGLALGALTAVTPAGAAIPRGDSYQVEAARSMNSGWFTVGTYSSQTDALRAANRYKLQGYAVRMYRQPGRSYTPVPSFEV